MKKTSSSTISKRVIHHEKRSSLGKRTRSIVPSQATEVNSKPPKTTNCSERKGKGAKRFKKNEMEVKQKEMALE